MDTRSTAFRFERIHCIHGDGVFPFSVYRVVDPATNRRNVYVRRGGPIPQNRWTPAIRQGDFGPFMGIGGRTYSTRREAAWAAVRMADWREAQAS